MHTRLTTKLATSPQEVRAAQRLRYRVFTEEFGADLAGADGAYDADAFDPHCDHLLLCDQVRGEVVGTYRAAG